MTKIPEAVMRWWKRAPRVMGAVIFLVVGLGAGAAYGYFTHSGSGSGAGSTGSTLSVTVVQATGSANSPLLFPGGSSDLVVELNNPNTFAVTITGIAPNGSATADAGHATCVTTGVAAATQSGLSFNVPASSTNFIVHVASGAIMTTASQTGCQGATFSVPVTLTVQKG